MPQSLNSLLPLTKCVVARVQPMVHDPYMYVPYIPIMHYYVSCTHNYVSLTCPYTLILHPLHAS